MASICYYSVFIHQLMNLNKKSQVNSNLVIYCMCCRRVGMRMGVSVNFFIQYVFRISGGIEKEIKRDESKGDMLFIRQINKHFYCSKLP